MDGCFIKRIFVMTFIFILLFSNMPGTLTGTSKKDHVDNSINSLDDEKNNKEDSSSFVILNAPRLNNGLANSPWPVFRHDLNHTGRSQYDTTNNNGEKKWELGTGNYVYSSPAIGSDGTIYIGSNDHKIYALYPNGTKKWDFATGSFVSSSPAIGSDGTIYVGSDEGNLYALNPNGTEKWVFDTGNMMMFSSPTIGSDGTIYVGSDNHKLIALYPNGTKKWAFTTGSVVDSSAAIGPDGTIYIGSNDYKLYALSSSGTKKWDFATKSYVASSPAIGPDGTIYFGSYDGKLYSLFPNGIQKWNFTTGDGINSSPAIGSDGIIYFGSHDAKLYALYPNGTKKWDFTTWYSVYSSPAISSDGTIYFGSSDYNLYALYPNGTKKWNYTTGDMVNSSPAIGSDGTIYVGSFDHKVYAIGIYSTGPQDLQAIGGNAQVKLTWTAPNYNVGSAITNYTVYRGTTSGYETFLVKLGNVLTYQDNNVTNGQKYYYAVTANNILGESPRSNEASATPATTPKAPQNPTAAPGNAQITLKWTAPADNGGASITNYEIYRNGTSFKVLGNVLVYTDSGLVNGVRYSYNISAQNSVGEGPKSIEVNVTPRTVPTAPQGLNGTLGNAQIVLTWLVPASNGGASITNYNIYRGTISGGEILFVKGYTGGTSWVDTNIIVGSKYYYTVSAINIAGEGPRSGERKFTAGKSPSVPTGLTASGGDAQVILRWSAPTSGGTPIQYNIYRSDSQTGTYTLLASHTTTNYNDTGLTNGHNYWYRINAQNSYGVSGNITAISATPHVTNIITAGPFLLGLIVIIIVVLLIVEITGLSRKKKAKPRPASKKKRLPRVRSRPGIDRKGLRDGRGSSAGHRRKRKVQ